jgi:hypothetical protein
MFFFLNRKKIMKWDIVLLYAVGGLVLIYIQYRAYAEYIKSKKYKAEVYDQELAKTISVVRNLEETYERKPCVKKIALLFSFDYAINFSSITNTDKINKLDDLFKYNFVFSVFKYSNIKFAKNTLHNTLTLLNNETLHGTQTLVFIWVASLATQILVGDKIENALVFGDDVISESKWKEMYSMYKNLKFICFSNLFH